MMKQEPSSTTTYSVRVSEIALQRVQWRNAPPSVPPPPARRCSRAPCWARSAPRAAEPYGGRSPLPWPAAAQNGGGCRRRGVGERVGHWDLVRPAIYLQRLGDRHPL